MLVLGLIDSKPATAVIVQDDGHVLSAISEERLCRLKMAKGFPRQAIARVLAEAGVAASDIDRVAIGGQINTLREPEGWPGWFDDEQKTGKYFFDELSSHVAPLIGSWPQAWRAHHSLKRFLLRSRTRKLPAILRQDYGILAPATFYDHHLSHAASAYYTSGFDQSLVVTLDGGGDGLSGGVYVGENGILRSIAKVDSFNSLGNFYSYVTVLCGFKAELHEGKITGLAALGEPEYAPALRKLVRYQEPGQMRYTVPMYRRSALRTIAKCLPEGYNSANLAASVQLVLEEVGLAFIRYWLRRTGLRRIALAGGVFANVKLNQRVHELDEVDEIFVHPAMDDSGTALGSALLSLVEASQRHPSAFLKRLSDVYFGPEYSESEIEHAVLSSGCEARFEPSIHSAIADLLVRGAVVARFVGRMEYGPRALGHRSVLYQTTDPSVNDWLNARLKRTEFMPFAPATLVEHAHRCYEGISGAEDPARFMTITFPCTPEMQAVSPGVVHVDGTARPQIVDPATAPDFYSILQEYYRRTGIPSVINTSFNMHGEPIVCSPEDALRSFQEGNLDYLAIGNWLVRNPTMQQKRTESCVASGGWQSAAAPARDQ